MDSKTPIEEWYELIMEAKEVGISIGDVRNYIQQMRNNNK